MLKYNFKKKGENKVPLINKTIEKRGHVITFTIADVEKDLEYLHQKARELVSAKEVDQAKMKNVQDNHPEVTEMPEVKLIAAHLYQEARLAIKAYDDTLKTVEGQINDYNVELAEVRKQLKLKEKDYAKANQQKETEGSQQS